MPSRINMGPDGGPYIAINENSGNIELEDNTGTTVAIWDDANSQWDFQNNPISNVDSLTSNSVNTESLVIGGKLYEEDDNSPYEIVNSTEKTINVQNDYSEIIILPAMGDTGEFGHNQLQINGIQTSDYDYVDSADVQTTGDTKLPIPPAFTRVYIHILAQGNNITVGISSMGRQTGVIERARLQGVTDSSISEIRLFNSDGKQQTEFGRIYGREL